MPATALPLRGVTTGKVVGVTGIGVVWLAGSAIGAASPEAIGWVVAAGFSGSSID
jgi:uncharacterized membrane protein